MSVGTITIFYLVNKLPGKWAIYYKKPNYKLAFSYEHTCFSQLVNILLEYLVRVYLPEALPGEKVYSALTALERLCRFNIAMEL